MANIVDSFVLEFGLDPSKFTAGQKQAIASLQKLKSEAEATGKDIEQTFDKRIRQSFSSLKREALTFVAAAFGANGIKQFVVDLTNSDAAVGRLSRTLKVGTNEISRWQGVLEQVGGSAQDVSGSMQGLQDKLTWFDLTGQGGDMLQFFNQLGVKIFDDNKKIKDSNRLLIELSKSIHGMDPARARSLLSGIGIDGNTINAMIKFTDQIERILEAQGKIRDVNQRAADNAEKLQGSWHQMTQAATDLGSAIANQLTPFLVIALGQVERLFTAIKNGPGSVAGIGVQSDFEAQLRARFGGPAGADEWLRSMLGGKGEGPFMWLRRHLSGSGLDQPEVTAAGGAVGGSLASLAARGAAPVGGGTRATRNNNPGNIEYGPFARAHGATGTDGRFAIFPSLEYGKGAMDALLAGPGYQGLTLAQIQQKWVGNQDSTYLGLMSRATGVGANGVPNLQDPAVRSALAAAMARGEGFGARAPGGAGGAPGAGGGSVTNNNNTTVNMVIHSPATDARGLARDVVPEMRRQLTGADTGQE